MEVFAPQATDCTEVKNPTEQKWESPETFTPMNIGFSGERFDNDLHDRWSSVRLRFRLSSARKRGVR